MSSASGIFPPNPGRHGPPRAALKASRAKRLIRIHQIHWSADMDNLLMEHMSNGLSFRGVAKNMGLTHDQVSSRFKRLRESMGWQAT